MIALKNLSTNRWEYFQEDFFTVNPYLRIDHNTKTFDHEGFVFSVEKVIDTKTDDLPAELNAVVKTKLRHIDETQQNLTFLGYQHPITGLYKILLVEINNGITNMKYPNGDNSASYDWDKRLDYSYE